MFFPPTFPVFPNSRARPDLLLPGQKPPGKRACSWLTREQGMTMVELLVAIGILMVTGAFVLPTLNSSALNSTVATQNFIGDLRMARANATSRGTHYLVELSSQSYTIQRLQQDFTEQGEEIWVDDGSPQQVDFPAGISLSVEEGDGLIEFDSRGLVLPNPDTGLPEVEEIAITDSLHGQDTVTIEVWPSGQVLEV